jgi:AcrR family transcriptional regulator
MPRTAAPHVGAAPSLRERKKHDKRQRIRAAARELFARQGYDDTTLRQIAQRAHVALGTLFRYADDKRDLVFLVFNEELGALTDDALAAARPGAPLVEQLLAIFAAHYHHFAHHLVLSRLVLQELTFYSTGKQADAFHATRARLIAGIEQRVAEAQRAGQLRRRPNARLIARHIFFLYSAAIRWWIAGPAPRAAQGLAELRQLLQLQMEGLAK